MVNNHTFYNLFFFFPFPECVHCFSMLLKQIHTVQLKQTISYINQSLESSVGLGNLPRCGTLLYPSAVQYKVLVTKRLNVHCTLLYCCSHCTLMINDITEDIVPELRLLADHCVCYGEIKGIEDTVKLRRI